MGRTLALANVAVYLSRFSQNVVLLDFDLEAPGLHYKFSQELKTTNIEKGLVDFIYEFTQNKVIPKPLDNFTQEIIPFSESHGTLQLFPAGNVLSADYWKKLAAIDWHGLVYEAHGEGIPFFLELKERIEKQLNPDFLLIDSRTGITEMSGICTSILPDHVVFLIINNQENIEGARQILRSIQRVERLPSKEPIGITFVLTRIPLPRDTSDKEFESELVTTIRDFLNEPTEDLESQLNIKDVCILHSDRELELSETLRLGQDGGPPETPLYRDYLRLFSTIIPDKVVTPHLDSIFDGLLVPSKLFADPDGTQKELENLVTTYSHPKGFERLIDFYFLRNERVSKILETFNELWEFRKDDPEPRLLRKYASLFKRNPRLEDPRFELEIIEKYLALKPDDRIPIKMELAYTYERYDNNEMAIKNYFELIDEVKEKGELIGRILDISIKDKSYDAAISLFAKYPDIFTSETNLLKVIEFMSATDMLNELEEIIIRNSSNRAMLMRKNPMLYRRIVSQLGVHEGATDDLLDSYSERVLSRMEPEELIEVGVLFTIFDMQAEFKRRISRLMTVGMIRKIISQIEKKAAGFR